MLDRAETLLLPYQWKLVLFGPVSGVLYVRKSERDHNFHNHSQRAPVLRMNTYEGCVKTMPLRGSNDHAPSSHVPTSVYPLFSYPLRAGFQPKGFRVLPYTLNKVLTSLLPRHAVSQKLVEPGRGSRKLAYDPDLLGVSREQGVI